MNNDVKILDLLFSDQDNFPSDTYFIVPSRLIWSHFKDIDSDGSDDNDFWRVQCKLDYLDKEALFG